MKTSKVVPLAGDWLEDDSARDNVASNSKSTFRRLPTDRASRAAARAAARLFDESHRPMVRTETHAAVFDTFLVNERTRDEQVEAGRREQQKKLAERKKRKRATNGPASRTPAPVFPEQPRLPAKPSRQSRFASSQTVRLSARGEVPNVETLRSNFSRLSSERSATTVDRSLLIPNLSSVEMCDASNTLVMQADSSGEVVMSMVEVDDACNVALHSDELFQGELKKGRLVRQR